MDESGYLLWPFLLLEGKSLRKGPTWTTVAGPLKHQVRANYEDEDVKFFSILNFMFQQKGFR